MTNSEAKTALQNRTPVTYNGIDYAYISAIIYRCDGSGKIIISVELTDKNKRSVTIASIKEVQINEDQI